MKKGKIKFSKIENRRGLKLDFFRVVNDVKNQKGDWVENPNFPLQNTELDFYFPFSKMENNIKVSYSGYCQLPSNGKKSALKSYFVISDGIDCPMIATPDGHNGKTYDGRGNDALTLTQERLDSWSMVKKRMTVFIVPKNWAPHEYLVWHTTSEIAIGSFTQEYLDLSSFLGSDLSFIPLCFRAVGKSGKSITGVSYRFFHGSIGANTGLDGLLLAVENAKKIKFAFNAECLEKEFEKSNYFNEFRNDHETLVIDTVDDVDSTTGEVTSIQKEIDYAELLSQYVNKQQATSIIELVIKLEQTDKLKTVNSTGKALALLNSLNNENNSK